MKKEINIYWLIPIILISGLFGFLTNSYSFFKFKNEIDLVSLFSLLVTTTFGFYISSTLQKNLEAKKFEKELIQQSIKQLNQKIKNIDKYLSINSLKFSETTRTFKDISSLISELKDLNEICSIIEENEILKLRTLFNDIKPIITGAPTSNNKFVISNEHRSLSKNKLKEFKYNLIKNMVKINRK